jgi:hypothetical protein
MSERTVLEWEEYVCNRLPAMRTKNGKYWDIYVGGGTIDSPTYRLSVGNTLIIQSDIDTIEIAFKMAQWLQDVLDGSLMETVGELVVMAYQRGLDKGSQKAAEENQ